jgi:hypothetical protein
MVLSFADRIVALVQYPVSPESSEIVIESSFQSVSLPRLGAFRSRTT